MKSLRQVFTSATDGPKSSDREYETRLSTLSAELPIVVELFQSQGCSSCPAANEHVLKLINTPGLIVLTYDVTYWDRLGWTDTFGNIAFDRRQWDYARALGRTNVFTPQVIIDGRIDGLGNTARDLHALVDQGIETKERVAIRISSSEDRDRESVTVSGPHLESSIVNMIVFSTNRINVAIAKGENQGIMLPHDNIVRGVKQIGTYHGGSQTYHSKLNEIGLSAAILVQASSDARILGAACL